jgi:predicted  nucleic acid-binding Zn-ribbon protein
VTDISVRHDPSSGAAAIEIRGAELSETRFRLRDPYTEKYLTKRGWSKNAAILPAEAATVDDVITIPVAAELARRIVPGTNLVLDQPTGEFQELLTWPLPIAMPMEHILAEETPAEDDEDDADEAAATIVAAPIVADAAEDVPAVEAETPTEAVPVVKAEIPAETKPVETARAAADQVKKAEAQPVKPAAVKPLAGDKPSTPSEPLLIDSFEPSIMHDDLDDDDKRDGKPDPAFLADNDNSPSTWKPIAIAAAICLVAGTAIGAVWNGYGSSAAMKEVREAAASQIERQKWEFDRQLKDAKAASLGKTSSNLASETKKLTADRDSARKALAEKEKTITALKAKLATATTQLEAVKTAAGDKAKAEIAALGKKIGTLSADLDKANSQLADREQALHDVQAKLADANDGLTSAKESAKQEAEALNDDLARQTGDLKKELDGLKQQVAQRDNQLRDVQAKLSVANIQIDALKAIANKTTEAGLEKGALDQKVAALSAELDKTQQQLSDREQALSDANSKLKDAEANLASANQRNEQLVADADNNQQAATRTLPPQSETTSRMQEERDLYADELRKMTASFTALQQQKTELEKTVAQLQSQTKPGNDTTTTSTSQIPQQSIWGATAIDTSGAVYHLQNQPSKEAAVANVNALCHDKSGSHCETLATYSNACFSLARFQGEQPSSDNFAYFIHKDSKRAAQTALERCESMGVACTTRFTSCSPESDQKADLN